MPITSNPANGQSANTAGLATNTRYGEGKRW